MTERQKDPVFSS